MLLLASILLNPEDGKEDNYILSPEVSRLIPIDNDHIFLPSVHYETGSFWSGYKAYDCLQSKSLLFCLDEMTDPLLPSCLNHLSKILNKENFLEEWFKELATINDRYQALLDEKALGELWNEKGVSLRISIPEAVVKSLYWKLELMKELLNSIPAITPLEILSRLEPYAGKKYQEAFMSTPLNSARPRNACLKQRFQLRVKDLWTKNQSTSTSISLLNSRQMIEILNLPESEIYGAAHKAKIGPNAALDLLEGLKEAKKTMQTSSFITHKDIDASSLTKSQETEQLTKFLSMPQERIAIYNSKVLSSNEFSKYCMAQGGTLLFLDLRGAQYLDQQAFAIIAENCLNLEYLNTSSWPQLKKAIIPPSSSSRNAQPMSLLKRWVIKDCPNLKEIEGEAPLLLILEAADNWNLESVSIKAPKLEKVDLNGLNALTEATLKIQGSPHLSLKGGISSQKFKKTYLQAIKGEAWAQCNLGLMYYNGKGVAQDYSTLR